MWNINRVESLPLAMARFGCSPYYSFIEEGKGTRRLFT
jgi:hypothetical protein